MQISYSPCTRVCVGVIGDGKLVDEWVYEWFAGARSRNIHVYGRILQEKALKVAGGIRMNDFRASNGWLEAFCKRHNVWFRMLLGERIGMDQQVVTNRKQNLPRIVQGYDKKDIYGTWTRVGFSGKGVPNRNLVYQGGKCKGSKLAKKRLTITFLCSTVG